MTPFSPNTMPASRRRMTIALELLAAFAAGVCLMSFIYVDPRGYTDERIGAPGYDSFYHVKMAEMMPEVGLVSEFPWLRYVYFTQTGDQFVSHHYGFHVLLMPFVHAGKALVGDALAGGRWAICFFFGINVALIYALLIAGRVPLRWLWFLLLLLAPGDFYLRQSYIRAISPSLMFMLAILLAMFRGRYVLTGILVGLYNHLYLGAVMYSPVLVAVFVGVSLLGPRGDRQMPWKLLIASIAGWTLGVLTYPYRSGMFEFLQLQVLGTGLSPDIPVGMEWEPYGNLWGFAVESCGVMFVTLIGALVLRVRTGPSLTREETTLLALNFFFLAMTIKARRFIEYWPPMCVLTTAYLAAAPLRQFLDWVRERMRAVPWSLAAVLKGGAIAAVAIVCTMLVWRRGFDMQNEALTDRWVWGAGLVLLFVAPVVWTIWTGRRRDSEPAPRWPMKLVDSVLALPAAACVLALIFVTAGDHLVRASRQSYCGYDLRGIKNMLEHVASVSEPGDVIFTDDWDVFPVYFYFNAHNNYLVGLDPKFTQERRPDLWARYVKITRGQVPDKASYPVYGENDERRDEVIKVRLEDIRDEFGARFVLVDRDHQDFARKLADSDGFASLIWPPAAYEQVKGAAYLLFEVGASGDAASSPAPARAADQNRRPREQRAAAPSGERVASQQRTEPQMHADER